MLFLKPMNSAPIFWLFFLFTNRQVSKIVTKTVSKIISRIAARLLLSGIAKISEARKRYWIIWGFQCTPKTLKETFYLLLKNNGLPWPCQINQPADISATWSQQKAGNFWQALLSNDYEFESDPLQQFMISWSLIVFLFATHQNQIDSGKSFSRQKCCIIEKNTAP